MLLLDLHNVRRAQSILLTRGRPITASGSLAERLRDVDERFLREEMRFY